MIFLILGIILLIFGIYCFVKPDNFFLPYLRFYYNPKRPLKLVAYKGGLGARHVKEFGKTKGILLYMRILGIVASIIGLLFILIEI